MSALWAMVILIGHPHVRLTMSGPSQESLSFIERTSWARYAFVLLLVVIGTVTLSISWDDAGASTSILQHRIFLIGAVFVWAIITLTLALVPWWKQVEHGLLLRTS